MVQITITGNVGQEPKVRMVGDKPVATFSVATSSPVKKNGNTEFVSKWWNVTAWEGLAELVGDDIKKGSKVIVAGTLTVREYTGRDGQTRQVEDIRASAIGMLLHKPFEKKRFEDIPF